MPRPTSVSHRLRHQKAIVATAVIATLLTLAACSSSPSASSRVDPSADTGTQDDVLAEGGELLVWAWEPTLKQVVADFEAEYPNVDIELANVGTGNDHYVALQNAISAGSGVPDIAQVEYHALPQFTITDSLTDLTPYGASDLGRTFSPGTWDAVTGGTDAVHALPMDSGPMALFYNEQVFTEAGVAVPTTWDEFADAAEALQDYDPDTYITADNGISTFTTSMIWQAGGRPFTVDGTTVTVDLADEGTLRFATMWQQLIDQGLVADISDWSDEWFQGLSDGSIAALVTGAWMPANLSTGAGAASGDWRVARMPQWTEGANETAELGGSSLAVTQASQNQELAYEFLKYANIGDGVATRLDAGAFPATMRDLTDPTFLAQEPEYFGGQQINRVLADSATHVLPGFQYLPYQVHANSIYPDTVGQAYTGTTTLIDGLTGWQDDIVRYGTEQGFDVNR
ncbi:carbohydrate ABC transporter substrate-binding protein (CUT1 family) [Promicromonospora sp. AC04]|uniref:ABC transporter substrate-binding protein n=1 Tax=Promicromonospora sp. AC04 TaxID=2135723 RepID=UPI000D3D6887|nr:sugar ABC transporter substrate-binding protein [Promicromonospora sp. AC04]PUB32571.1 carbohydrate ABC transporter substrate-binding protein (CUT1 family) [Promicromonospora sp. AC04]